MSGEVAIHIKPAERPFNWVYLPILVTIELLEMVVGQLRSVRVRDTCTKMIPTRIVALRAFQHAVIHEIRSWLHDDFRHPLLMNFHASMALRTLQLELSRYRLDLRLNSLRLALSGSGYGALLGTLDRQVLPLLGLLLGRLSYNDDRSRLFCFFGCRNRQSNRGREYSYRADRSEYNKFQEPVRHCLRNEGNEVRPDARPQARESWRCIRWDTLRIFSGRERSR